MLVAAIVACADDGRLTTEPSVELDWRLGGATTARDATDRAFNLSARSLSLPDQVYFAEGNEVFEHFFTEAEGLGPGYNGPGCMSCHVNNGRGPIPDVSGVVIEPGPVIRVSLPDGSPVPGFGSSVQLDGPAAEGRLAVLWSDETGTYPDGMTVSLRRPAWSVDTLPPDALVSVRTAPGLAGLGLLGAIPAVAIEAAADPDDADGDGVSGRPSVVDGRLGRFGWRATAPDVLTQTANALADDMGISTSVRPDGSGRPPEMSDEDLAADAFYAVALAVPAMREVDDPAVVAGASLFAEVGCASCHTPRHETGFDAVVGIADQTIWPYTDLLLHDMGDDLADGTGFEWRTPPLWGLGLHDVVNGNSALLHDGRARNPEEAILWHGGEAAEARRRFMALPATQRARLLTFLGAL